MSGLGKLLPSYDSHVDDGCAKTQNISLAIARLGVDDTSNIIFHSLAPKIADSPEENCKPPHWDALPSHFKSNACTHLPKMIPA